MIMRLSNMRAGFTLAEGATHVAHCENSRKQGFTLAEVLITLGIIGVVAAMTMPTLINQTQGAQYKAAYKKALSALSQAVTLNVALDEYNFADVDAGTGVGESDKTVLKMLTKRMNVVKNQNVAAGDYIISATGGTAGKTMKEAVAAGWREVGMNDGITFFYNPTTAFSCTKEGSRTIGSGKDAKTEISMCYGVIDVNGQKAPNKYVTCDDNGANIMDKADDDRTDADKTKACSIKSPTDIYPVFFFDQSVVPASAAAKAVLYGK